MGKLAGRFQRFPLLLKFLDVLEMLSVQVHPSDADKDLLPAGETGKTEAWVVLEAGTRSRIYAGLRPGASAEVLRRALSDGTVADHLACFHPKPGDAVFNPAGMVHSLGGGVMVFEVQENSDVTFRLYDWNHVDPKTHQQRRAPSGPGACLHRFCGYLRWSDQAGSGGHVTRNPRETFSLRTLPVVASVWTIAVYRLALQVRQPCWYASRARGRSSMAARLITPQKATCFCYRRFLAHALSNREAQ